MTPRRVLAAVVVLIAVAIGSASALSGGDTHTEQPPQPTRFVHVSPYKGNTGWEQTPQNGNGSRGWRA